MGLLPSKSFWCYWFPVVLGCAALFIQSHHATPHPLPKVPGIDKLLHVVAYAVLGALFFRALRHSYRRYPSSTLIWLSILFTALYGLSDEVHQMFVTSRSTDIFDWVADTVGGAVGVYGFYRIVESSDSDTSTPYES